jgi:hypothetical protein
MLIETRCWLLLVACSASNRMTAHALKAALLLAYLMTYGAGAYLQR